MALNLSSMTPQEQIATLFIAYFDRAPAPSGLDYWVGRLNDGMSIAEIATSFAAQPETLKLYPELGAANAATPTSNLALVTDIFNNLFGRDPAGGADNYWVQQLNNGADIGSIIINIASGAVGDDKALLENKIEVGLDWSTEALIANIATVDNPLSEVVDGKLNILDEEAYESAKTVLDSVTADPATVDAAKAATDDFIAAYGNDAPIAANDTAAVDEDGVLDNGVISTAADPDGDVLIYSIAPGDAPSNGAIVMNADGTYVYTPDADFNGTDTFTYTVTDPSGETDSATVTITVAPQNDAPIAGSIQGGAIEGGSVATVDLKAVTSDIDGDALTYALVTSADGVSIDSATGVVSLDPTVGAYDGLAQGEMLQIVVGYSVSDGTATVQSTVQFTVTGTNDAPVASGSVSSVAEDNSVMGTVLATDVDGSADDLVYSVAAGHGPSNGALSMDANGAYTYTPDADFNGTDSFTYTVTDADGGQDTAVVTINVAAVDDAPVASNATASVNEDATISGQLVATDIDNDDAAIVYTVDTNVAGLTLNADGSWEFNAADVAYQSLADGETQVVATTYTATSNGKTDTGAINITVTGTNDAPQAQALTVSGIENLEVVGRVQATDVDGDALTFTVVEGSVQNGAVSMDAATGAFVFTPNPFFSGEATFDYTVSDGDLTSTETVTIDVADVVNVLTTGVDNIPLTGEGVEVVRGSTDTLNPGDRVSGSEEDIVSIGIDGDNPSTYSAFEIDGIGKFVVTNDGSNPVTFDMSSSSGIKTLASENSTNDVRFDFANMNDVAGSADQELDVEVRNLTNGVNFTLDVRDIDQGGDDIVNMLVVDSDDDMLDADTINIVADSQADGSTETASGIEEVNLSTAGSTGSVRINDLNTYGVRTLNISTAVGLVIGDAAVAAGIENAISSTIETVDATGSTGSVTLSTVDSTTGMDVTGGDGNDVFELGGTNDTVDGGAGNDTITATGGDNNISGGDGDDYIVTGDGDDVIDLGEGNDFVDSGAGDDTITNDGGNNMVIAGDGNDSITLGDGDNYINSGAGDDTITAGNGDNDVISGDGNDSITLGDGYNIVDAGAGNDSITLGHGPNDITAGDGDDAITAGNGDNDVDAGAGNDSVTLGDGNNIVDAGDGTNAITAGDGQNEVYGGANVDSITLGDGGNYVEAGAGNDAVTTGDGIDAIDGGDGDDTLSAGGGDDTILGGAGADDIYGGAGADLIQTGDATDASDEFVDAGAGDDTVITRGEQLTGADVLRGGADNDTLNIDSANGDTSGLNNVTGFETINLNGGNHAYTIANGLPFDADTTAVTIDASDVNKTGADSANVDASTLSRGITLIGGDGDDTLIGGAGDDVIVGDGDTGANSGGVDDLRGGAGNDQFLFETGELTTADAVDGGEGDDEIVLTENSSNAVAGIGSGVTSIERVLAHDNASGTVSVEFDGFTNGDLTNVVHVDGSQLVTNDLTVSQIGQTAATADGSEGDDVDLRITGGQGDDEFALGQYLDAGDTIDGGSVADGIGYDDEDTLSLEVNAPDTLADVDFTNVSNIEILRVFSTGGGTVVLGQAAFDAGIHTVVLDGGPLTLDASAFPGELTIFDSDASNTITGPAEYASVIKMAGGDDIVTTGLANDTVEINDGDLTFADTITDNGGTDAVVFQNGAAGNAGGIAAAVDLTNVTGIEEYNFAEDGTGGTDAHSLTFRGGNVDTLTQITVDASGVEDTDDSLSLTLEATVDVDYAFNITGTSGDDLFVKEGVNNNNLVISGADGDDILRIDGGELGSNVLFDGGEGDETDGDAVQLSGGVFRDDDFVSLVDGTVERLITVDGVQMDAVLGEEAASAGISKIEMGDDGGTVLLDPAFTNDLEVVLGSGADQFDASATDVTLTIEGTATDLNGDLIQGGAGADDVINVTADGTTADVTQVSGVESYVVGGEDSDIGLTFADSSFTDVESGRISVNGSALYNGDLTVDGGSVTGSNAFDIVASAGDDNITTGTGDDVIDLGEGNDFVDSGAGDDTITNDGGNNTVIAGDGDDSITLGDGDNDINSGAGDDSITLGNGNNLVAAGEGDNSVAAGDGDNAITAGAGRDIIELGDGDNTVDAGEGNNDLTAGDGNNTVTTGAGIDILALGDGDNTVDAGDGDNTVTVGTGSNSVTTGAGVDTVTVLAADVGVVPGGNLIKVGAGDDVVTASGGDDVIFGGFGVDILSGGDGADSFHYAERDESYSIYQDRITDFESGIDQIVIEENLLTQMGVEAGITLSGVDFVGTVANFGDAELAISTLPRLGNGVAEAVFQQDTGMFWVDLNDDGELDGRDLRVEVDFADGTLGSMSAGDVALLDTLAPAQALAIDLQTASDSGVSDTDNLTNADPVSIDVSFEVAATDGSAALEGDLVKLYVDGVEVDVITLTAGHIADGFVTFTGSLAEGQNDLAAEIIDQTGNSLGVSDTLLTVTADRTAPNLPVIDTVAGDDIVNAAEETDLVISGTGEAGVAVAVSGDSGFSANTTVDQDGNWSVTVSDASDTFGEGAETLSVTFTDDAGNVSATETRAITVDTIAPTIAIDTPLGFDDIVNAAEDGNVSISGTTTGVEDGQVVTVTFTNTRVYDDAFAGLANPWALDYSDLFSSSWEDAGGDLYDDGNYLYIDDVEQSIWDSAGNSGSETWGDFEFTTYSNGALLQVDNFSASSFSIEGEMGYDGSGTREGGALSGYDQAVFYEQVYGGGDPSLVKIYITDATAAALSALPSDTDEEFFELTGLEDATSFTYAMFAGTENIDSGYRYSEEEIRNFVDTLLTEPQSVTVTTTVSGNTWEIVGGLTFTFDQLSGTGEFDINTFFEGGAGYGILLNLVDGVITSVADYAAPSAPGAGDWDVSIDNNVVTLTAQTAAGQEVLDGLVGAVSTILDGTVEGNTSFVEASGAGVDISGLDNGDIEVTADVSDFAGNPAVQASTTVELDNIAPDAPSITHFADDTGASDSDGITNDEIITLYGVGEPGATIEIFDNGESVGTTLVEEDGGWGFTTASLSDGSHNFTATATDVAGNTSPSSAIEQFYAVNADEILPSSGTFTWTGPVEPTGTAVIYDTEPGIEGLTLDDDSDGDETATADVTLGSLVSIGSDVDAEESWLVRDLTTGEEFVIVTLDVEDGPASGNYTLSEIPLDPNTTYEILDYSGNPDVLSGEPAYTYQGGTSVIIDTVAPTVDLVTVDDTMLSESDVGASALKITIDFDEAMDTNIDPTLALSGEDGTETTAINAALTLDASLSGWIDSDTYEAYYDLTDTNLEADDIDIEVTLAEDVAGNLQNSHDELNEFSIDTVVDINAVDLLAGSDTGLSGEDDITYETTPTFRIDFNDGVRVGDSIELLLDGVSFDSPVTGTVDATDVSNGYIDLSVTGEDLGADGDKSITAEVTDLAGNTDTTGALTIHLDTLATIGAVDLVSGSDTGSSDSDDNSYDTTPTFQVTLGADAEAGDSVELLLAGAAFTTPVTKTLDATDITNGYVQLTVTDGDLGADGDKSITAKFTDVAGNTATSAALTYTLDTTAPAPTITSIVYDNELDTLVINGSSLNDVTFDATKMTWDIQGTSATDFTFETTDLVGNPTVTGSQISMQLTAEASDALEGLAGFAGSVEDNFDFGADAWTDTAGNVSAAIDDQTITLNLLGTDNDDVIYGGSAGDTLKGGLGGDILWGQQGDDTIDVGADVSVDYVVYNTNTGGKDTIYNFDSGEDKYDTNFATDEGNFGDWVNLATNTTSSGGNVTITASEVDNDVFYYSGALGLDPTTATRNEVMVSLESALNSGVDTSSTNGSFSGVDASAEFLLVLHDTSGGETYVLEVETGSVGSVLDLAEADLVGIFVGQNLVNGDII